jgi:hypothetical protein
MPTHLGHEWGTANARSPKSVQPHSSHEAAMNGPPERLSGYSATGSKPANISADSGNWFSGT